MVFIILKPTCRSDIIDSCQHLSPYLSIFLSNILPFDYEVLSGFLHCSTQDVGFLGATLLVSGGSLAD